MATAETDTDTSQAPPLPRRAAQRRPGRAGWRSLTAVGAGLLIALVVMVHAVVRAPIPPLLVFALVAVAILVLLRRGPVRVAAGLALLLGLVIAPTDGAALSGGLALYRDPYEFTLTIGGLMASLSLLVGGGVLMLRGRRADGGTLPRALSAVAVLAVVAALATSVVGRFTAPEVVAADGDVRVATRDIAFQPTELRVPAGEVTFLVDNLDPVGHTFTVDALGLDAAVAGATAVRVSTTAEPGEYRYVCTLEGHDRMVGTLVVE